MTPNIMQRGRRNKKPTLSGAPPNAITHFNEYLEREKTAPTTSVDADGGRLQAATASDVVRPSTP